MDIDKYQQEAMKTLNPALDKKETLINGVMGLCGESGEVIDIVKKHLSQGHPLNVDKLVLELGDVAWYLAETAYVLGYNLSDILKMNLKKLNDRYPDGFDINHSINRKED